jgi:urease accessory protein
MLQISKLMPQGAGLAPVLIKRATTVELDWDVRQKSRFDGMDSSGRQLGVFLPRGAVVRGGDVLVAEDGSLIRVIAAPQQVLKITYCSAHGSPFDLIRAAYHLGNRHVQIELKPDHLKIEPDHVLADMLRALHLIVNTVQEPFEPEAGAYSSHGSSHEHRHEHGHTHGHAHEHAQEDARTHPPAKTIPIAAAAPHDHVHGPDCKHDHDHHDHSHSHPGSHPHPHLHPHSH